LRNSDIDTESFAYGYALAAHRGQKRKYTGEDYINHPMRVAGILSEERTLLRVSIIPAAYLHDVIEDCAVTQEELREIFGPQIATLVMEVTSPSKQFPELPRAERKRMDHEYLAKVSNDAKTLKAADRVDNLRDLMHYSVPVSFVEKILKETNNLCNALEGANPSLLCLLLSATGDLEHWNKGRVSTEKKGKKTKRKAKIKVEYNAEDTSFSGLIQGLRQVSGVVNIEPVADLELNDKGEEISDE